MGIFCEFKRVTQDRSIFINPTQIILISHGDTLGTTKIELAEQRTLDVQGTVEMTIAKLEQEMPR
jgi:hypothetical protein